MKCRSAQAAPLAQAFVSPHYLNRFDITGKEDFSPPAGGSIKLSMHPRHPRPGGNRPNRPTCNDRGSSQMRTRGNIPREMHGGAVSSHIFDCNDALAAGISSPERGDPGDKNAILQGAHLSDEQLEISASSGFISTERLTPRFVSADAAPAKPSTTMHVPPNKQLYVPPPKAAGDKKSRIEVLPGVFSPLRGSAETWEAILGDMYLPSTCDWCATTVFAVQDCGFVLCPRCGAVYPTPDEMIDRVASGVGLGFTFESLVRWQPEIERDRRSRCSCGGLPIH